MSVSSLLDSPVIRDRITMQLVPTVLVQPLFRVDRAAGWITFCGELDLAGVPVLTDAMSQLLGRDPGQVTIDASGLTFIDAAGLSCLAGLSARLAACGSTISIVGAPPRVRRVFGIVRLDGLLAAG